MMKCLQANNKVSTTPTKKPASLIIMLHRFINISIYQLIRNSVFQQTDESFVTEQKIKPQLSVAPFRSATSNSWGSGSSQKILSKERFFQEIRGNPQILLIPSCTPVLSISLMSYTCCTLPCNLSCDKVKRYPLDTGRIMNIQKILRRRPEHLLNAFCKLIYVR